MDEKDFEKRSAAAGSNLQGKESTSTEKIPVIEEQLHVGRKVVETGRVQINKEVREEEVTINDLIAHEEVDVERVTVNRYVVNTPPAVRREGDKIIIPVLREVAVVEKRLMVVEELHVTKRKIKTPTSQTVTLRKEDVTVQRINNDSQS